MSSLSLSELRRLDQAALLLQPSYLAAPILHKRGLSQAQVAKLFDRTADGDVKFLCSCLACGQPGNRVSEKTFLKHNFSQNKVYSQMQEDESKEKDTQATEGFVSKGELTQLLASFKSEILAALPSKDATAVKKVHDMADEVLPAPTLDFGSGEQKRPPVATVNLTQEDKPEANSTADQLNAFAGRSSSSASFNSLLAGDVDKRDSSILSVLRASPNVSNQSRRSLPKDDDLSLDDDERILDAAKVMTSDYRRTFCDWLRSVDIRSARNMHECAALVDFADLIVANVSPRKLLATVLRRLLALRLADKYNNYNFTDVLSRRSNADVPFDPDFLMKVFTQTDRASRLVGRLDNNRDSYSRGGGSGRGSRGSYGGRQRSGDNNNNNNGGNNRQGSSRAPDAASRGSGGAQRQ